MERPFIVLYLIGVCIAGVIRITQSRKHLRPQKPQIPPSDFWLMFLWFLASQVLPMLYGFSPILTFADYLLPRFLSSLGVGILGIALWLLRQSHLDCLFPIGLWAGPGYSHLRSFAAFEFLKKRR